MKRHVALVLVGLVCLAVSAGAKTLGPGDNGSEKAVAGAAAGGGGTPTTGWERPELLRQIGIYETAAAQREAAHIADGLAKIYVRLASMYADLAMYPRSEEAMKRGIALLRQEMKPEQDALAAALDDLAMVHVAMGDLGKAEKEGQEALKLRLKEGDRRAIGSSYRQLAALYLKRHAYKSAVEFGERGLAEMGADPKVNSDDWIAVRFTTAKALCESGSCGRAIPLVQQGIEQAKVTYGETSLPVGIGYFQLGTTYWHDGATIDAARALERGVALMKVELGWGHPTYVTMLREYAKFLREHGTEEAAMAVEREVRQADAKVDVSTMAKMPGGASSLR